jgi:Tol biopolymer transport system component
MNDGSRDDLWITNVDGTDPRKIFDCEGVCDYVDDPAWSPDGGSVAVCIMTAAGNEHLGALVSVDVATTETTTLYTPDRKETFCAGPRWSPDGRRIVLELVDRNDTILDGDVIGVTLTVIDLSTDPVTTLPLTDPVLFAATADWNRDGDLIVYSALAEPGSEGSDLYTIAPDGSGLQRRTFLSDQQGSATEPSFDIDGTTVVFVSKGVLSRLDLSTNEVTSAFANPPGVATHGQDPPYDR